MLIYKNEPNSNMPFKVSTVYHVCMIFIWVVYDVRVKGHLLSLVKFLTDLAQTWQPFPQSQNVIQMSKQTLKPTEDLQIIVTVLAINQSFSALGSNIIILLVIDRGNKE